MTSFETLTSREVAAMKFLTFFQIQTTVEWASSWSLLV